mmetsp:Transcript_30667/g.68523  ORF Transcript_30667/g.68523 Transcript_30667/m.68523 type:complete len:87 (-) Transcript_30667:107-367(-)
MPASLSIILFTALPPPPPTPITLILQGEPDPSASMNDFLLENSGSHIPNPLEVSARKELAVAMHSAKIIPRGNCIVLCGNARVPLL